MFAHRQASGAHPARHAADPRSGFARMEPAENPLRCPKILLTGVFGRIRAHGLQNIGIKPLSGAVHQGKTAGFNNCSSFGSILSVIHILRKRIAAQKVKQVTLKQSCPRTFGFPEQHTPKVHVFGPDRPLRGNQPIRLQNRWPIGRRGNFCQIYQDLGQSDPAPFGLPLGP